MPKNSDPSDELAKLDSVLIVTSRWTTQAGLKKLALVLERNQVTATVRKTVEAAAKQLNADEPPQVLLIDSWVKGDRGGKKSIAAFRQAMARLRHVSHMVPVVFLAKEPAAELVTAAFRAGGTDVLDLSKKDDVAYLQVLKGVAMEHQQRRVREERMRDLRLLVEDFLRVLVKSEKRALELEAAAQTAKAAQDLGANPRVLVVDDEAAIVDMLMDLLSRRDLDIVTAYTGEEALAVVERIDEADQHLDIALVDKNLPGIDGLQTIAAIRKLRPSLPCVVMTGYTNEDSAIDAANLGVVGYVRKPFDSIGAFADRVNDLARRFAAERGQRAFLRQIKLKHARFLHRYQRIANDLNQVSTLRS